MGVNLDNPTRMTTPSGDVSVAPASGTGDVTGTAGVVTPSPALAPSSDGYAMGSGTDILAYQPNTDGIQTRHGDKPRYQVSNDPAAVTQVSTVGPDGACEVHSFDNVMAVLMNSMLVGSSGATEFVVDDIPVVDDPNDAPINGSHPLDFVTLAMSATQGDLSAELNEDDDIAADMALIESANKFKT